MPRSRLRGIPHLPLRRTSTGTRCAPRRSRSWARPTRPTRTSRWASPASSTTAASSWAATSRTPPTASGLCAECGMVSELHATGGGRSSRSSCVGARRRAAHAVRALPPAAVGERRARDCLLLTPEGVLPMRDVLPQAFGPDNLSIAAAAPRLTASPCRWPRGASRCHDRGTSRPWRPAVDGRFVRSSGTCSTLWMTAVGGRRLLRRARDMVDLPVVFTRAEALAAGLSDRRSGVRGCSGSFAACMPGRRSVDVAPSRPRGPADRARRARSRRGQTAAVLLGGVVPPDARIHLRLPRGGCGCRASSPCAVSVVGDGADRGECR